MYKLLYSGIMVSILMYSCQPKLDFPFENDSSKLVIWSVLHPDSTVSAFLSKTLPPLSKNADNRIKEGSVILFENNNVLDTLKEDSTGHYISKKGLKPQVGNVYQIVAAKEGFTTIKTPKDTMPQKPFVIKATFEDSVRTKQGVAISRISVTTNAPSHFENYGFGRHVASGLPWQSDTILNGFFNNVGSPFLEDGNASCEDNGSFLFLGSQLEGYRFILPNCKYSHTNYEMFKSAKFEERYMKNAKFKFTICAITYKSIAYTIALNKLTSQYGDYYSGINVFWSPIQLPNFIENGYGFFACYNTTNVTISAR